MPDTAALVVALSAQLTKFEKDMKDAVNIANARTKEIETSFSKMNDEINKQLGGIAQNFSSRLGGIGSILGSIGPVGGALAVGIGAAIVAIDSISESVDKFIQKQKQLKEAAESTGLSLDQLKAAGRAGQQVGLDFEQTEKGIEKLTSAVATLQSEGTGPLEKALAKLGQGWSLQVAGSADVASAIDSIAKAFDSLDNEFQKNEFLRAVFGKRDIQMGRFLTQIAGAGGIGALTKAQQEAGNSVDKDLNANLVKTQQIIAKIRSDTENLWGKLFAPEIQQMELSRVTAWYNISKSISDAVNYLNQYNEQNEKAKPPVPLTVGANVPGVGFVPGETGGYVSGRGPGTQNVPNVDRDMMQGYQTTVTLPPARPGGLIAQAIEQEKADAQLAERTEFYKRFVGVLGDAATQSEVFADKQAQLVLQATKEKELWPAVTRQIQALTLAQQEASVALKERMGIASLTEIEQTKLARVEADAQKFGLTAAETERARAKALQDSAKAYENMAVAASRTPELTRLAFDAQNTFKQIDTLATTTFSNFENAMGDIAIGATSVADAFKKMADSIIKDLVRMTIKMSVTGPLASALSSFFNPGAVPIVGAAGTQAVPTFRQGGGPVFAGTPYIVGEHGPEFFVPHASGQIIPGGVSKGAPSSGLTVTVNNYASGQVDTTQERRQQGSGMEELVIGIVKRTIASGDADASNRARFGLRPNKVR